MLESVATHLDKPLSRVISGTSKLHEFQLLGFVKVLEILGREFNNDLTVGGMLLAHIGSITESQWLLSGGRDEGLGELWDVRLVNHPDLC